ncbi:PYM1 isoform 6, partial [Pan troglodytes]
LPAALRLRRQGWEPPNLSLLFDFTLGYHQGQRMEPR